MILQQNFSFSQSHKNNLGILGLPIGENAATGNLNNPEIRFAAYCSLRGQRFFDLSSSHLLNPLGHNHPVFLKNFAMSSFSKYKINNLTTSKQAGNFIYSKKNFFDQVLSEAPQISVQNFHGFSFDLEEGDPEQPHMLYTYLNYYSKLKIFESGGMLDLIKNALSKSELHKNAKLEGISIKFPLPIKKIIFEEQGIFVKEEVTDTLYIPLSILLDDIPILVKKINKVLCSN